MQVQFRFYLITRFSFYKQPGCLGVRPEIRPKTKQHAKQLEASNFKATKLKFILCPRNWKKLQVTLFFYINCSLIFNFSPNFNCIGQIRKERYFHCFYSEISHKQLLKQLEASNTGFAKQLEASPQKWGCL